MCKINSIDLDAAFWSRLEKMFEFVLAYSRPDGSVPMIGDADDGRLFRLRLSEPISDHRHMLSIGAVLFRRGDFKGAAGSYSQDALFLLGAEGFERFLQIQADVRSPDSRRFAEGGFVIMRSSDLHLLADVGDIGMNGRGGHGHNDTLSFDLWARGAPLIVDPGTYVYTSDVAARQLFRSTRMHNTAVIAGREIAEFNGLWQITQDTTDPRVLRWESDARKDILVARHSGYGRLPIPVLHQRTFALEKETLRLEVTDQLQTTGPTAAELFFHLHPDVTVEPAGGNSCILCAGDLRVKVECSHRLTQQESWYSPSYGLRTPSTALCVPLSLAADTQVHTQFIFS
ncbi:MAG: heparinase II/III-family protein [Proteobacteria bacterium]|nr:heparinase II/III-family protein [Pseudomonadota bacterium]